MEMSGEYRIPAPREKVWAALNDPQVLKETIPGCQSVEKLSDTEMTARVKAKVGPVSATFNGTVDARVSTPVASLAPNVTNAYSASAWFRTTSATGGKSSPRQHVTGAAHAAISGFVVSVTAFSD